MKVHPGIIDRLKTYKLTKIDTGEHTIAYKKQVFTIKDFSKIENLTLVPHFEEAKGEIFKHFKELGNIDEVNERAKNIWMDIIHITCSIFFNTLTSFEKEDAQTLLKNSIDESEAIVDILLDMLICIDVAIFAGLSELNDNKEEIIEQWAKDNPEVAKMAYKLFGLIDTMMKDNEDNYNLQNMKTIGNA